MEVCIWMQMKYETYRFSGTNGKGFMTTLGHVKPYVKYLRVVHCAFLLNKPVCKIEAVK